jgi:hypothetical protein
MSAGATRRRQRRRRRRCLAAGQTEQTSERHSCRLAHGLQKASKSPTRLARQRCRQQRPQSGSEHLGQTGGEPAGRDTQCYKGVSEAGRHEWLRRPCGAVQHSSGLKRYLASAYPLRRRMRRTALPSMRLRRRRSLQTAPLPHGSLTCATDGRTATRC